MSVELKNSKVKHYDMTIPKLFQAILTMDDDQRAALLKEADRISATDKRGIIRKDCHLPLKFANNGGIHSGVIKNISTSGAFIEANTPVMIGEDIHMLFELDGRGSDMKPLGTVVHANRWGIGVAFKQMEPDQAAALQAFTRA